MFIYKFFKNLFRHIKYQRIIDSAYQNEMLIARISTLLGVQFKLDWIKRLYAVINPNIKDGKYNPEQIYEFDFNSTPDNTEWVTKWIMERLQILQNFMQTSNLFDVIEYHIKDLDNYNYLVVFQSITLAPLLKSIKWAVLELAILVSICVFLCSYL